MNNDRVGLEIEELEEVEIEECARRGKEAPRAKRYVIRIDKERKVVTKAEITGREILSLVGKTPEQFKLYQHKRGMQPSRIEPDEVVNLRAPGVERFSTMPKDTTEGRETATLRHEFSLPESDEQYLDGLDLPWETVVDGGSQWLIIHKWKVPTGYNHSFVSLALLIPPSYSDAQIDMVYFNPALQRRDGRAIGALSTQHITVGGSRQEWQRWSRHRTGSNPWRPGVDDVASHLGLVDEWLRREFEKG